MSAKLIVTPKQVVKGKMAQASYMPKLQHPLRIRGWKEEEYDGTSPVEIWQENPLIIAATIEAVKGLNERVADLEYVPIAIDGAILPYTRLQKGQVAESLTIHWKVNKMPEKVEVAGVEITEDDLDKGTLQNGTYIYPCHLDTNTSIPVVITDERGNTVRIDHKLEFYLGVYHGAVSLTAPVYFADEILSWDLVLQNNRKLTFMEVTSATEHIGFALPVSYGTPTFTVGGFEGGFFKAETVAFINEHGHTEDYDVWLSKQMGLGITQVTVT